MVRLAAAKANNNDIKALYDCIADMEAAGSDYTQFMKHDIAFHRRIAEITGNPIFSIVSEAILGWLSRYHTGVLRKLGREGRTLDEHRLIADRIAAHDVDGAAAAMLMHQTRASDLYRPPSASAS
jgi:DNA-binding FadR family transcriptional regulator